MAKKENKKKASKKTKEEDDYGAESVSYTHLTLPAIYSV